MEPFKSTQRIKLTPGNNKRLTKLCGQFDENLHLIARYLGVEINNRGNDFEIIGIPKSVDKAAEVLKSLYKETAYRRNITANEVLLHIREINYQTPESSHKEKAEYELKVHQLRVKAHTPNQQNYLNSILHHWRICAGEPLNDLFLIFDEAQNATKERIKMFLTRISFCSKAVITGDVTQTDLPKYTESGLRHAIPLLRDIDEIQFTFFKSNDIIRHPVVQRIIKAYEEENEASY